MDLEILIMKKVLKSDSRTFTLIYFVYYLAKTYLTPNVTEDKFKPKL